MATAGKPGLRARRRVPVRWLVVLLGAALCAGLLAFARVAKDEEEPEESLPPIITVDELRPGQRGFAYTTVQGAKPTRFGVEVLGVLRNVRPQLDMVLVRLDGDPLSNTGIIMGMSGSPVYIDGRLAGAIAYTWSYAKEPIAGVTPIENMLQLLESKPEPDARQRKASLSDAETPPAPGATASVPTDSTPTGLSLAPFFLRWGADRAEPGPAPLPTLMSSWPASSTSLVPLPPAVSVAGLPPSGLRTLVERFERAGFVAVAGGTSAGPRESERSQSAGEPGGPSAFEPGSPMVIQLVRGDIDISALGTVTVVVGDRVIGFGHPLMGQRGLELPLATGFIQAVIPRQHLSLQLCSVGREVGATETDGLAGLVGRLGHRAPTIPVTFSVHRRDLGRHDTYRFEVVRHPTLTPGLLSTVTAAILDVGGTPSAESSAHLVTTFEPAGYPPLRYDDWFSGPNLTDQIAREVAYVPDLLLENPFGPVELKQITISAEVVGERRVATIESITLKEVTLRPGDTVEVEVTLVPYRRPRQRRTLRIQVPDDAPPGPRVLVVGDILTEVRLDLLARRHHYEPRSLDELMSLLGEEFKQTHLYVRLSRGEYGVVIKGVELPALPVSVMQILSSPLETDRSAIIGSVRASEETPWVLRGVKASYLRVTDDLEKDEKQ